MKEEFSRTSYRNMVSSVAYILQEPNFCLANMSFIVFNGWILCDTDAFRFLTISLCKFVEFASVHVPTHQRKA